MVQKEKSVMKNKKMLRNIIIGVIVLAVLAGLYILVEKMPSKENKDDVSSSDYVTVYSENYDDITKVSVENSEGGFVIVKNDKGWFSADNDKIELGSDKVDSLLMSVSTVVGNVIEEKPKNLDDYGFSAPSAKVEYELSDGKKISFTLGSMAATGSGYYMKPGDSDTVYLMPEYKCATLLQPLKSLRNSDVFSVKSDNIKKISLTNKNGSFTLQKTADTSYGTNALVMSSWMVVSPREIAGNDEKIERYLFTAMQLNAEDYYDDDPAKYSEYGLDHPSCTVEYTDNDGNVSTLKFGKASEGSIYVKLDGRTQIFRVPIGELNVTELKYLDISSTLAMLESIDNVKSVIVETNSQKYELSIDRTGDTEKYSIDGKIVDESDFKSLYQKIIGVTIEGAVSGAGTGDFICRVIFKYTKDLPDKTVNFFTFQDRFASIIINGQLDYYTSISQVQSIIDGVQQLAK